MKIRLMSAMAFALLIILQPVIGYAHGDEHHAEGEQHAEEATQTNDQALKSLEEGIVVMASTMSDEKREEMFNDGPIMETWHTKSVAIDAAMSAIRKNITNTDKDKKRRIEGTLSQLGLTIDAFHAATHKRDLEGAQSAIKKAKGALKLLKVYLK